MTEVKTTTDYSVFRMLDGNRDVDERRVAKTMTSIQTIGWLPAPIIVNEKMEVIDGQGRLEALKRLSMPVEYVIVKGANIRHCRVMNSNPTAWGRADYIKSYAETGNKSYQRLQQMMSMYDVDVRTVLRLINRRSHDETYMLKAGEFDMTNEEFGIGLKRLPYFSAYRKVMKRFSGNGNVKKKVIFFLIEHGGYPHQEIVDSLAKCDPNEVYSTTDERLIDCIEKVYNRYKKEDKRLDLLSDYRRK